MSAEALRLRVRSGLPALLLAGGLGFVFALLITQAPLPALMLPLVLALLVLLVRQPLAWLLLFAASLPVPIQRSLAGLPINASDLLLVLWCALAPFALMRADAPDWRRWRLPTLVLLIAPFVAAVQLAQLQSIHPGPSFKQLLRIVEWFVVLPVALSLLAPDTRLRHALSAALMILPAALAVDGMVEYLSGGTRLSGLVGIPVPVPEGDEPQIRHTFDVSGRAGSTFGGAQGLAMYLGTMMCFALAHVLRPPRPWMRRLGLASIALGLGGLGVAQSRGGLLGALAGMLAMALVLRPALRLPLLLGTLFTLALGLLALGLWPGWDGTASGLLPGRAESVEDRLILWGAVLDSVLQRPLLGVGLGNFRDAFFADERWLNVPLAYASLHAHNTYLEILADTGILGLAAWLGFLVLVTRRLLALWAAEQPVLTLAALGTLASYAVFAMVDMLLLQNIHMLLVLLLTLGLSPAGAPGLGIAPERRPGAAAAPLKA